MIYFQSPRMHNYANLNRETPDSPLNEDVCHYESLVQQAQDEFAESILECINFLNSTSLKLRKITEQRLQPVTKFSHSLNFKLSNSLARNVMSVKRSLLTMNNILAKHTLLSIPYIELKCYNHQILEEIEKSGCKELTLHQALNQLQQICRDINHVEGRTRSMMKQNVKGELLLDDEYEQCSGDFLDEYKNVIYLQKSCINCISI